MKHLLAAIFTLALSVSCSTAIGQQPTADFSPAVKHFLTNCSGVPVSDADTEAVAFISCMTRMRGVVDGHMLSMYLYHEQRAAVEKSGAKPNIRIKALWCIPPNTQTPQAFVSILNWIDANPSHVKTITTGITNPAEAALTIIVAALGKTYQCTEA
jgi:hypothetical protein